MRKYILSLILTTSFVPTFAQDAGDGDAVVMTSLARLLRAQLTITPAWHLGASAANDTLFASNSGRTNIYLHGTLEYYFDQHFSVRGDGYYFINKNSAPGGLTMNHSSQVGFSWHLLKGMTFDPFIGLRGGMSFVKTEPIMMKLETQTNSTTVPTDTQITPIWAPHIGMNFFGQHVFHFFIEAQYLMGTYRPTQAPSMSISELRVSAGLGWNWVFVHKEASVRPTI